eukprot:TRINITY_DN3366_c0_g1_i3.p1 TRINITY_DN3366_c0_g1~~TRINITY_DN3366_c0_g1_i3.p1  ORF type:complete len:121 (-),score=14.28 TRINITY_DN3366_c0_g1_i3:54-416(-)
MGVCLLFAGGDPLLEHKAALSEVMKETQRRYLKVLFLPKNNTKMKTTSSRIGTYATTTTGMRQVATQTPSFLFYISVGGRVGSQRPTLRLPNDIPPDFDRVMRQQSREQGGQNAFSTYQE